MRFRFIGDYTNGHTSISCHGATFDGREPSEVTSKEGVRRLRGNPEFELIGPLDHDGDGEKGGSLTHEPPALKGMNKAKLLAQAEAEGVQIEEGATNKQIVAAIEAARG